MCNLNISLYVVMFYILFTDSMYLKGRIGYKVGATDNFKNSLRRDIYTNNKIHLALILAIRKDNLLQVKLPLLIYGNILNTQSFSLAHLKM